VLIVEDEALVCMLLEDLLSEIGCQVVATASNVHGGLSLVRSVDFDVAVLDVNLGDERSYPIADLLIESDKPFLFSTGFDRVEDAYKRLPRIQKPFRQDDLERLLIKVMLRMNSAA
jgi:DNA-binding response OmpR family regulator